MTEPTSPRDQFRRLAVLIAANCVDMIGFAIVLPLLPFYALRLEASPEMVGAIMAAFSIAQLLAAPVWGRVSDRYGRRPALLIGLSASAVAYVVFAVADSVWLLFLSRLVQGAGGGTTGVAQAYVADTIKPADRARALGWLSAATSVGVMIGPAIGSTAFRLGSETPGLVAAALCLVNVLFAWRWLPESRIPGPGHAPPRRPVWVPAWHTVRHPGRPVSRLIWVYGVGMLAFSCLTSVMALYLALPPFNVTEETIGYVFMYVSGLSVVMRLLLLGPIVDRLGETRTMRLGALSLMLGLALYPFADGFVELALVIPLVPIGTALLFPATTSLMSRHSETAELGTTMGVAQTFAGTARVIAPLLATSLFQRLGHATPFFVAAGLVAMAGALALRIGQRA
ncbi:MAG TPA: MFS transporter [Gemmatimonadales bacterium]|nr:MFS transporter [Gemmatimonadales bacterium]